MNEAEREALDDLLLGRNVKRGHHELPADLEALVRERLVALGFTSVPVGAIDLEIGERVPAWVLREKPGSLALEFGMVFWEVFTQRAKRKLFAVERRNAKGDWDVQISATAKEPVWAHLGLLERYDASRPVGMY